MMLHLNSCNKMNQRTLKNNYYNSHKYSDNGISFRSDVNSRNWNAEKNNHQYNKKYYNNNNNNINNNHNNINNNNNNNNNINNNNINNNNKRNTYNVEFPNNYDGNNNYNNKGRGAWVNDNGGYDPEQEHGDEYNNDYNNFNHHDFYKNTRNKFNNIQHDQQTNYYQQKQQQEMNDQFGGCGYYSGQHNNPSNIINNNNSNNDYHREEIRDVSNYDTLPNFTKYKNLIENDPYNNNYNENDTVVVVGNTNGSNYCVEQSNRIEREAKKNQTFIKMYDDYRIDSNDSSPNELNNAYEVGYGNKSKQGYGSKFKALTYNVANLSPDFADANDCTFSEQTYNEPNNDYNYNQYSADPQNLNQTKRNQRVDIYEAGKDWKEPNRDNELAYQNSSPSFGGSYRQQGQPSYGFHVNYPRELNDLLKALECQLCGVNFNSTICSRLHYSSKAHEKNLNNWLYVNYIKKGYEIPPIHRVNQSQYITNKDLHCSICDLRFTSIIHGQQHYEGRKHRINSKRRQALESIAQFDKQEGKKVEPEEDTMLQKKWPIIPAIKSENDSLVCKLCNITATSATQLDTHFHGASHQRKSKLASMLVETEVEAIKDMESVSHDCNNINSLIGYEKYRTKNGQYYCSLCQVQVNHVTILKQHLFGRKHLKRETLAHLEFKC